jgi:hypothetical protein
VVDTVHQRTKQNVFRELAFPATPKIQPVTQTQIPTLTGRREPLWVLEQECSAEIRVELKRDYASSSQ